MKSILILITCLFSIHSFATEEFTVKSKIKSVVVYQQGAQIQRQGNYTVKKGITEIKISGVSAQIDANTLQIKATGNVVILDSKHAIIYPEPIKQNPVSNEIPPKIKKEIYYLQDSLFDLSYQQTAVQNKMDVLLSQKRIIENNGTIKGEGKVNDSIPLLKDALKFYHEEMNRINANLLQLNREKTLLAKQQNRMNFRLGELNNYNRNNQLVGPQNPEPIHEIIVTVSASEGASGRLEVTYLVQNAGWIPLYDLRSSNSAKTIELTYKAQVYQNTGIDWKNTRLNLSTNNPYANKTKPILNPWFLDYYTANYEGYNRDAKKSIRATEATSPGSLYNGSDEYAEEDKDMSGMALTADQFVTTVEQLVSVEYAIDLPYTIKSDNQKNMVLVKTSSLSTDYLYYTVPKLDPSVYLIAQITDLDKLNLIPGKATIFHDGSYLGATYINPNTMKDTMDLSLGKTTNITVKRQLIKNATKEKIIGDKIVKTFAYQIEVRNLARTSIELIVEDQVPVSRNPEIEIEIESISRGKLDEINGFVTWKDKIKPGALNKYELIYTVKYEKTKPINLAGL
ncbi:MAG: mucoidy inhibitor MuiA family protein [Crocinitomix sp.]|nr:mucoidy inhibitor MuiA family protein [Crocinitomix sp.]